VKDTKDKQTGEVTVATAMMLTANKERNADYCGSTAITVHFLFFLAFFMNLRYASTSSGGARA